MALPSSVYSFRSIDNHLHLLPSLLLCTKSLDFLTDGCYFASCINTWQQCYHLKIIQRETAPNLNLKHIEDYFSAPKVGMKCFHLRHERKNSSFGNQLISPSSSLQRWCLWAKVGKEYGPEKSTAFPLWERPSGALLPSIYKPESFVSNKFCSVASVNMLNAIWR